MPLNLTATHYKGAANEHIAAARFLADGYQVYWPAVQQSNIDFVAFKDGNYQTVQVKTAWWNKASGPHHYLQCRIRDSAGRLTECDICAVVFESEMWLIPGNVITSSNISLRSTCPNPQPRSRTDWEKYKCP